MRNQCRKGHVHFYDPLTKLGLLNDVDGELISFRYTGNRPLVKGEAIEFTSSWHKTFAEWVEPIHA